MVWLYDGEKIEEMFIRFDRIHERNGQTDTACQHRSRLHSVTRQKLLTYTVLDATHRSSGGLVYSQ